MVVKNATRTEKKRNTALFNSFAWLGQPCCAYGKRYLLRVDAVLLPMAARRSARPRARLRDNAEINAYIKANPKEWNYIQGLPRERDGRRA